MTDLEQGSTFESEKDDQSAFNFLTIVNSIVIILILSWHVLFFTAVENNA
jgi:hypothetical protein